jgi:hypothetical protein
VFKSGKYWLYHGSDSSEEEPVLSKYPTIWLVLNDINKQSMKEMIHPRYGYKMNHGDTLRFGKIKFRVKKISSKEVDKSNFFHPLAS